MYTKHKLFLLVKFDLLGAMKRCELGPCCRLSPTRTEAAWKDVGMAKSREQACGLRGETIVRKS